MFLTMFIVGHMEIGNGYCRTDIMLHNDPIAMEYPCEYYYELKDLDIKLQGQ
jgi:hypothetical protein